MCNAIAAAVIVGGGTAIAGIKKANADYNAAKASARRQNQINQLQYQNELNIKARKDLIKSREYERNLEAQAAATTALYNQKALNQQEQTRASITAQQELKEKLNEMAFEEQNNLIKSIQAQGTILAGDQQAGQSLLLSIMEVDRQLGFEAAQTNASMRDANTAYGIQEYGFGLDKFSADMAAMNRLPGAPSKPWAEFLPQKRPDALMPSKAARNAAIFGAIMGGASAGLSAGKSYSNTTWSTKGGGKESEKGSSTDSSKDK
tara:strand:+ start:426 stop:1211 length:786 start_codon:yes stop_codon:yes gene_type:complete